MKTDSHKDLKETIYNSITKYDIVVRIIIPLRCVHIHAISDIGDRRHGSRVTYRFTS